MVKQYHTTACAWRLTKILIVSLAVAESAAVAMPHTVKGEALYCFVTLRDGFDFSSQLESELKLKGKSAILQ